jgi:transposase
MIWGCISGKYGKGRGLFWEKEWGTITTKIYCEYTVLAILNYLFNYPGLSFQQDGGTGYKTAEILALLKSWNIKLIFWPPFLLDLSPIENIWNRLKDILQKIDPEVYRNSERLRAAVLRAWETITDTEIKERIRKIHQRCLDVIAAGGMETKW